MEYYTYNNDELTHWGIKGMRWGVRRFQNKDGSLTPAGKKRRAKLEGELEQLGGGSKKTDSDADATPRKKTVGEMTDDELDRAITRARKEDEYRRLRPEPVTKPKMMNRLIDDVIVPSAISSGKKLASDFMDKAVNALLGNKVDPDSVEALKKVYDKLDYQIKIDKLRNPDKYLSEEERKKRQEREFAAEDRAARMKGFKDAADEAESKRNEATAKAAAAKTHKLAGARESSERMQNDSAHNRFIDRVTDQPTPRKSPWQQSAKNVESDIYNGRTYFKSTNGTDNIITPSSTAQKAGKTFVDSHGDTLFTVSESARDTGRSFVDTNGDVLFVWGDND